ncbi:S-layer homology domain-containing protein, partial [Paenibacillus sedimenti]
MNQSRNKMMKKMLPVLVSSAMMVSMLGTAAASAPSDINGHWAAKQLNEWQGKSWIQGYADGSVKPNNTVTRAEFMAFINRAFGLTATAEVTFKDVNKSGWEYAEIGKAVKAGYISGYDDGTIRSGNEISRQEAASIIAKLLNLNTSDAEKVLGKFADSRKIALWSKHAIAALSEKGIINGYEDSSYRPEASITRAEAIVTIDRALAARATVYDKAGTYGPESGKQTIEGDVVITAPGVTLRNVTITGNLVLAEGIGSGDAFLEGVTVKGSTTVKGGGENSVHFKNTVLVTVIVNKKDGSVRIVAEGSTTVQHVTVQSSTKIEESGVTGNGFKDVDLGAELPKDSKVTLVGDFENVDVAAKSIFVEVPSGSINKFNVGNNAGDSSINLSKDAKIVTLVLDAIAKVLGDGKVEKATVNDGAKGTTFDKKPDTLDGSQKDSTNVNTPTTGGGGGGSSSSGGSSDSGSDNEPGGTVVQSAEIKASLISTFNYKDGTDYVVISNNPFATDGKIFTVPQGATVKVYDAAVDGMVIGSKTITELSIDYNTPTVVNIADGFGSSIDNVYVTITESGKSESIRVAQSILKTVPNAPDPVSDNLEIVNRSTGVDELFLDVPNGVSVIFYDENKRYIPDQQMIDINHYKIVGGFNTAHQKIYLVFERREGNAVAESPLTEVDIPAANHAPQAKTLSNLELKIGMGSKTINVSDLATDLDGNTLSVTSATYNIAGKVNIEFNSGAITVSPIAVGHVEVNVTVKDIYGESVNVNIPVEVIDSIILTPISDLANTSKTDTTAAFSFATPTGATAVKVQQSTDGGTT